MTDVIRLGTKAKRLDLDVATNGVTRECPWAPGVHFTVLPWGTQNKRYKQALQKWAMQSRAEKNGQKGGPDAVDVDPEEGTKRFLESKTEDPEFIVDAVLADIDGLLNEKNNPIKYTRERGLKILSDPEWAHVRDWVVGLAMQAASTYKEDLEEEAKN